MFDAQLFKLSQPVSSEGDGFSHVVHERRNRPVCAAIGSISRQSAACCSLGRAVLDDLVEVFSG
ncbi:MAG: hypothetical protein OXH78_07855, partial [Acidimicrobiaceae bacterium]|nr:hypothetical protein [Acidimicrobiaceae bacterium]